MCKRNLLSLLTFKGKPGSLKLLLESRLQTLISGDVARLAGRIVRPRSQEKLGVTLDDARFSDGGVLPSWVSSSYVCKF